LIRHSCEHKLQFEHVKQEATAFLERLLTLELLESHLEFVLNRRYVHGLPIDVTTSGTVQTL